MASDAREESSNPYGGGLGTGGKFRKQTPRRSQKTPYDRPPTSMRNFGLGSGENLGGGWLSKLVDPAHRLFASVFQKRLGSGETSLHFPVQQKEVPDRDVNQETKQTEDISNLAMKNDLKVEDTNAFVDPTKDGSIDLEKLLQGKTFTRSEVDRLTTLLRSKAADSSTRNEEHRNEVSIVVRHPPSHERNRTHADNGSMIALVSTPPGSSRDLDEVIASPAQLAKAYMGSRPSEVTPSMLGSRGQAVREDSVFHNRTPFPSKSPTMSMVPKPSAQRPLENGFLTPRSLGRSAVYSMARTPYSRPQSSVKIGSLFQAPPSTWEGSLSSRSRQVFHSGLKRKNSVLDNDIGSVGPVRRIRQKSNFSSRSLAMPSSETPHSARANGEQKIMHTSKDSKRDIIGSSFNFVPSKSSEMASKILQQLDNLVSTRDKSPSKLSPSMIHGQALKSLQNVEAPNFLEKLPEKRIYSPDCSHKKHEKTRESGSIEFLAVSEKTGGAFDGTSKAGSSKDQETRGESAYLPLKSSLEEHRPTKRAFRMSADEDFLELEDDQGPASTPFEVAENQNVFKVEKGRISLPKGEKPLTLTEAMHSTSYVSNGDACQSTCNGSLETGRSKFAALPIEAVQQNNMASEQTLKFIQGKEKSSISPGQRTSEEIVAPLEEPKKAAALFQSQTTIDLSKQNTGTSTDIKFKKRSSIASEIPEDWAKPTELKKMVSNNVYGTESTTTAASIVNSSSIISAGANAVSLPPINNGSLGSSPSSFRPNNSNIPSDNSVSALSCPVPSLAATPTASSVFGKLPAYTSNDSNSVSISQSTSAPPFSSTSPFKFGEPAAPFSASVVSTSSEQISKEPEVKTSTFGNTNTFKFGDTPSVDPSTAKVFDDKSLEKKCTPGFVFGSQSPTMADTGNNIFGRMVGGSTLNPSTTASSVPGNSGSLIFGVTSSSTPGTETSKFSASTAATNAGSNSFGTSTPAFTSSGSSMFGNVAANTGSSVFGFNATSSASAASSRSPASNLFGATNAQTSNAGRGTTTSTQSVPFQFGSSASAPSFGMSGNTSLASDSSPFVFSKSEPAVFSSGSTPQLSSTNSSASSSGTTSSPLFGTSWQAPNSAPAFSSSFTTSSTPTFNFGGSSAATGSSVLAPSFGASTNTPSSSPIFSFSSVTPTIPQQPVFGNPAPSATTSQSPFGNSTPGFGFGAPNTNGINNNQEVSMEDSMAEDTDQANKPSVVAPMLGQSAVSSMPQPNFAFGGAAATPPPMVNPFQFGGQLTAGTQQNINPFQATTSTEFQGGGSFSLGSTGGGSFSLGSTGGGDKSGRRIFKAKKMNKKK